MNRSLDSLHVDFFSPITAGYREQLAHTSINRLIPYLVGSRQVIYTEVMEFSINCYYCNTLISRFEIIFCLLCFF